MYIKDYIFIARPDHWLKNIFVLPGCIFSAIILRTLPDLDKILHVILAIFITCILSSANYTINEYLDSDSDKFHPVKKNRPGASGRLNIIYVFVQYTILSSLGVLLARQLSDSFVITSIFFLLMGIIYNIEPLRAKDRVYLDVVIESINNPIRFLLGWFAWTPYVFPPSSILLSYWAGGGFLMAVKRYAEYRFISNPIQSGLYRKSFSKYNETSLLLYSIFYIIISSFFLGIFLIKYRIEFIILFPCIAFLFIWYLSMSMCPSSAVQSPEKIFHDKKFFLYTIFLGSLTILLALFDIPSLNFLLNIVQLS
jgi:4-hydroxybenzoate polyprenyltransferase